MASHVEFLKDHGVVIFRHSDTFDGNDLFSMRCSCSFALSVNGWRYALIDLRKAHIEASASEFAYHFRNLDNLLPIGAIVAMVEPIQYDFDYCKLAKSVVNAWTASEVEVFQNERDALRWLVSNTECKSPARFVAGGTAGNTGQAETLLARNHR